MLKAIERARATFRFFWRELAWEYRRIIPAFGMTAVKMIFSDEGPPQPDGQEAEQMWVSEIDFDGHIVAGTLLNEPNWVTSVKSGDRVARPLNETTDWMLTCNNRVYGAFTVHVVRSRMNDRERAQHDAAWGLEFGDPATPLLVPASMTSEGTPPETAELTPPDEHPMSENMSDSLAEAIKENPALLATPDPKGFVLLHSLALAGSSAGVRALLEGGADANVQTPDGRKPIDLARAMGWTAVVQLLKPYTAP